MEEGQILIVSDHEESACLWAYGLSQRAIPALATKLEVDDLAASIPRTCGLMALDINEQNSQVLSLCRRARSAYDGPILLCTYERDERFHVKAYEAGIDESISKPIGNLLFLAKVLSWLHTVPSSPSHRNELRYPDFHLDCARRVLTRQEGTTTKLSSMELRLLLLLINNHGNVVVPDEIVERVWPENAEGNIHLLKSLVYRLRQKIEPAPSRPQYIETVVGFGYRFRGGLPEGNLT